MHWVSCDDNSKTLCMCNITLSNALCKTVMNMTRYTFDCTPRVTNVTSGRWVIYTSLIISKYFPTLTFITDRLYLPTDTEQILLSLEMPTMLGALNSPNQHTSGSYSPILFFLSTDAFPRGLDRSSDGEEESEDSSVSGLFRLVLILTLYLLLFIIKGLAVMNP